MTTLELEIRRLRAAAEDSAAWSLFAADDATARQLEDAAHTARVAADTLEGALPLGIVP